MVAAAIRALTSKLDEDDVLELVKSMLEKTCEGTTSAATDFDIRFAGSMGHLFSVLAETLKYQYADFFGGAGGVLEKLARLAK